MDLFYSLVPPLLVFIVGFFTHRIRLALGVGIMAAALMSVHFAPWPAIQLIASHFFHAVELDSPSDLKNLLYNDHLSILTSLLFFGVLTEIICKSNAADAFQRFSRQFVKDSRSAETSCVILSFILCIDDYLSALVVGAVMRPLTDRFQVARAKLAYLCDSLAAPLAAMTPISSWSAAILGMLMEVGIHETQGVDTLIIGNPYSIFLQMIPYMLYSIALIASVLYVVRSRISFGPMATEEKAALIEQNCCPEGEDEHPPSIADFLVPIMTLLGGVTISLLYTGGFFQDASFLNAILGARIAQSLLLATTMAVFFSITYYLFRGAFSFAQIPSLFRAGIQMMIPAILILLLTWTLGGLMQDNLNIGTYLGAFIGNSIPSFLLPLIVFWIASVISLLMGSAWGTMALFFPLLVPLLMTLGSHHEAVTATSLPLLVPLLGAVLSGAVFGNHISLIADTSVMAACSTCCTLIDHIRTQLYYALPVFGATSIGFLITGFTSNPLLPMLVSIASALFFLRLCHVNAKEEIRGVS